MQYARAVNERRTQAQVAAEALFERTEPSATPSVTERKPWPHTGRENEDYEQAIKGYVRSRKIAMILKMAVRLPVGVLEYQAYLHSV